MVSILPSRFVGRLVSAMFYGRCNAVYNACFSNFWLGAAKIGEDGNGCLAKTEIGRHSSPTTDHSKTGHAKTGLGRSLMSRGRSGCMSDK